MKRFLTCIASGVLVLGFVGCGDSGVTEGPVPFKPTDAGQFDEMKKQMMGNVKGPTPKKAAAADKKAEPEKKD
ncbi:MAG: hypothetical protein P4L85_18885 [Paludisphaera borealis]|uniref:hypothetical protein n=1 Tax=Paludisphaera borealis TaxID=1387353 RepID=UPI002842EAE9|nr:hypothetical protein [Paludisphaera borealis]MDR3621423.1 hypothetical protein [Paludisphaera borealis]